MSSSASLAFPSTAAECITLPNGLEIIFEEDHSSPVVSLQGWCRSGSIHEGDWLGAGLSHFLEHMLFKGTAKRNATEVAREVQAQGGYVNAYTSFDRTVYWIDAPSAGWQACLDVLMDVLSSASLSPEEFESERTVIHREITMGEDNPEQVISRSLFQTAYAVHPCRHPVIGYLDVFNSLERDDLYQYYQDRYAPDNLFLVIVGDVPREPLLEAVEASLGQLPRRRRNLVHVPDEPPHLGRREHITRFPTELYRGRLSWPVPHGLHPDVPALDLMSDILGSGRSSRLYRSLREEKQLVHAIGTFAYTPAFTGQWTVSFRSDVEKKSTAETAILDELNRFIQEGISEAELAKVQRQALSHQFGTLTDVRGRASDLGSNWLLARHLNLTRDYLEELQAVTSEQVVEVARRYLGSPHYTKVGLLPKDSPVATNTIAAPSSQRAARKFQLDNGLTVLLLSDHRLPFVQGCGLFRGGLLSETSENNGITRLMGRLLTKDTRQRSAEDLAHTIESIGGDIAASVGNNTFGVSTVALQPDLNLVVELLAETLMEPAFLPATIDAERNFQLAQLKAENDQPFTIAMKALRRQIYGPHPYGLGSSGTPESLPHLDHDQITSHWASHLKGGNGVVGVFGDIDLDTAEALVRQHFSERLAAGSTDFPSYRDLIPTASPAVIQLTHDKEQAVLLIACPTVDMAHPDDTALALIDEACSDMASRLFIRIREELGLAYSVGATRQQGLDPGMIIFYASTSPEKLDLVQEEMMAELDLMVTSGLEADELSRAKTSWLGRELMRAQDVRELASSAVFDELIGLGWDHYQGMADRVNAVDATEIQQVAARYLTRDRRTIVRLSR